MNAYKIVGFFAPRPIFSMGALQDRGYFAGKSTTRMFFSESSKITDWFRETCNTVEVPGNMRSCGILQWETKRTCSCFVDFTGEPAPKAQATLNWRTGKRSGASLVQRTPHERLFLKERFPVESLAKRARKREREYFPSSEKTQK